MLRYLLAWLPLVAIAVANGVPRQLWYARFLSELAAHQLSRPWASAPQRNMR